ncbi:MAG: aminoglycoside phosphotransferase family protein, partial [Lachnospiraceae bacterium]|nr:aminoglycoside phosphotransferase family protein [Lachnospiraceae bacterium]
RAFTALSDVSNFRRFITSGFDARFFNALRGDEYTVIKSSENVDKLRREYTYFTLVPPEMKQWYATVFNYREDDSSASYSMERYHMTDLALRYVHGAIGEEEFRNIMEMLFHFIAIRKRRSVSDDDYKAAARKLYIDKVDERIASLKTLEGYEEIASYIKLGTDYNDIDEIVDRYKAIYEKKTGEYRLAAVEAVAHGDLCFSNILYNHDARLLKLIDPKGAMDEDGLYMDPYYDLAKLSHSICGSYDYFNSDQYEITVGPDMKLSLKVDSDNEKYIKIFNEYLIKAGADPKLIRLYEASLFLSMLPLHIDRKKKVLGFILNAINILKEIE